MPHNQITIKIAIGILALFGQIVSSHKVYSHKIQTTEDVGVTFHIEPNDLAQAGKSAIAWFAITKSGGKVISLNQCDCKLSIYRQPRNSKPLLQPKLQPLSTEGYRNVPSANIIFPKVGTYELELIGKPQKGETFKPFKFNFKVLVAG
jgi:hypothetical protein